MFQGVKVKIGLWVQKRRRESSDGRVARKKERKKSRN